jgi:hypothetical protein
VVNKRREVGGGGGGFQVHKAGKDCVYCTLYINWVTEKIKCELVWKFCTSTDSHRSGLLLVNAQCYESLTEKFHKFLACFVVLYVTVGYKEMSSILADQ